MRHSFLERGVPGGLDSAERLDGRVVVCRIRTSITLQSAEAGIPEGEFSLRECKVCKAIIINSET